MHPNANVSPKPATALFKFRAQPVHRLNITHCANRPLQMKMSSKYVLCLLGILSLGACSEPQPLTTHEELSAQQRLPGLYARIQMLEKRLSSCSCPENTAYQNIPNSEFPDNVHSEVLLEAANARLNEFEQADSSNAGPKEIMVRCEKDPTITVKDLPDEARDANECM